MTLPDSPASAQRIFSQVRQSTPLSALISLGLHGAMFYILPLLPMTSAQPGEPQNVPTIELSEAERAKLPDALTGRSPLAFANPLVPQGSLLPPDAMPPLGVTDPTILPDGILPPPSTVWPLNLPGIPGVEEPPPMGTLQLPIGSSQLPPIAFNPDTQLPPMPSEPLPLPPQPKLDETAVPPEPAIDLRCGPNSNDPNCPQPSATTPTDPQQPKEIADEIAAAPQPTSPGAPSTEAELPNPEPSPEPNPEPEPEPQPTRAPLPDASKVALAETQKKLQEDYTFNPEGTVAGNSVTLAERSLTFQEKFGILPPPQTEAQDLKLRFPSFKCPSDAGRAVISRVIKEGKAQEPLLTGPSTGYRALDDAALKAVAQEPVPADKTAQTFTVQFITHGGCLANRASDRTPSPEPVETPTSPSLTPEAAKTPDAPDTPDTPETPSPAAAPTSPSSETPAPTPAAPKSPATASPTPLPSPTTSDAVDSTSEPDPPLPSGETTSPSPSPLPSPSLEPPTP